MPKPVFTYLPDIWKEGCILAFSEVDINAVEKELSTRYACTSTIIDAHRSPGQEWSEVLIVRLSRTFPAEPSIQQLAKQILRQNRSAASDATLRETVLDGILDQIVSLSERKKLLIILRRAFSELKATDIQALHVFSSASVGFAFQVSGKGSIPTGCGDLVKYCVMADYINPDYPVYVSYKWSQSGIVDKVCTTLEANCILYKRDKKDCKLCDSITGFEEEIGCGKFIIVVLSDDYFESLGCMYEMACITEHGDIKSRVFFIDAMDQVKRKKSLEVILKRWNKKKADLAKKGASLTTSQIKDLDAIDKIVRRFPDFWAEIEDAVAMMADDVKADDAKSFVSHITDSLRVASNTTSAFNISGDVPAANAKVIMGDKSVAIENFYGGTINIQ